MIGHNNVNRICAKEGERFIDSRGTEHGVARMLENQLAEVKSGTFVVDGQN
jgi:hypothetical protein